MEAARTAVKAEKAAEEKAVRVPPSNCTGLALPQQGGVPMSALPLQKAARC
jgi:hypothetical protein